MTQSGLGNVVAERLSARFCSDESFRSSVLGAVGVMSSNRDELPEDRASLEELALSNGYVRYQIVSDTVNMTSLTEDLRPISLILLNACKGEMPISIVTIIGFRPRRTSVSPSFSLSRSCSGC